MVNPEIAPFFEAARKGCFLVKRCGDCGKSHWYPRAICPFCGSLDTEWMESTGKGRIHAFSIMRRADPPFAIAYVILEEGPMVLTNIVDCDFDRLAIDQAVHVVFKMADNDVPVAMFTPDF